MVLGGSDLLGETSKHDTSQLSYHTTRCLGITHNDGLQGAGAFSGLLSAMGSSSSPSPTTMAGAASKLLGGSSSSRSSSGKASPAPGKSSDFGQEGGTSSREDSAFGKDADALSSTGFGQTATPGSSATSSKAGNAFGSSDALSGSGFGQKASPSSSAISSKGDSALSSIGSLGSYESSAKGTGAFGSSPDLLASAGLGQKGGAASSGKSSSKLGAQSEPELDASSSMAVRDALKSAKDATASGKGLTGFDGPESIAEMMDEQVKRTPGGSSVSLP